MSLDYNATDNGEAQKYVDDMGTQLNDDNIHFLNCTSFIRTVRYRAELRKHELVRNGETRYWIRHYFEFVIISMNPVSEKILGRRSIL